MPESPPVIEAEQLCRRFGRRWAFARVDLAVEAGARLLVVGANGSGKTTLLRVLGTVLRPSQGRLRLFGIDPARDPMAVRRRIALLSHHSGLYEDLSGRDNLGVVARLGGHGAHDAARLLADVGLDDRPDPVRAYSAGMRKRLQVATLLLQRPQLVLLDEPFAALDPAGVDDVSALLRGIGATLVVTSHRIAAAAALCDRALLLEDGLPRWTGAASDAVRAWAAVHPGSDPAEVAG
ncbi:MAG: ABC transporter ATP-binding protein [Myxococcota bacterium]|nr:ABC transporter ATP-binding protein [Myxococcota bacterium]